MNVLRLTNGDDVDQFLSNGNAGDVAYVDAGLMPALEDTAFNLGRQIVSRRSSEYPDLHQVRVVGARIKKPRSIEGAVMDALASHGCAVTAKDLRMSDALDGYSMREISEAVDALVGDGRVCARKQSGSKGGRPTVRFSAPE